MDIVKYTRNRSNQLADYLEECAFSPLEFEGDDPLLHSSNNHVHLWFLEHFSQHHSWVNLEYKLAFVEYILKVWKNRIKGQPPYHSQGYRLYVYQEMSPTVSVVANTAEGFPYKDSLEQVLFVDKISDVLKVYEDHNWSKNFTAEWEISHEKILKVISLNRGSIAKPSASQLGIKVGELRHLIINMGLSSEVNTIRKKYKRRPADFSHGIENDNQIILYEQVLPPKFS